MNEWFCPLVRNSTDISPSYPSSAGKLEDCKSLWDIPINNQLQPTSIYVLSRRELTPPHTMHGILQMLNDHSQSILDYSRQSMNHEPLKVHQVWSRISAYRIPHFSLLTTCYSLSISRARSHKRLTTALDTSVILRRESFLYSSHSKARECLHVCLNLLFDIAYLPDAHTA